MEEDLQQPTTEKSRVLLDTLLTQAPIGFAFLDRELRYVLINEKLAELNGLSAAEHISKRVHDIVPTLVPAAEAIVSEILRTGQPVKNHEISGETALQPGVTRYWNESWYPVRDSRGEIIGFGAIVEEITDRKRGQEALKDSERRLRSAADLVGLSPYSWNPLTGALTWDDRLKTMWGLPRDTTVTYDVFLSGLHPDDRQRVEAAVARAIDPSGDGVYAAEYRVIGLQDGVERWVYANGRTVFEDGKPVSFTGAAIETTERKREEQALRESQTRLRTLADELEQQVIGRTQALLQSREQLRALAAELNLAEQRERKRLATELHDHLQQLLVLSKLKLGQGKRLAQPMPACVEIMKQTDEILSEALNYTRTLVAELSPPVLREHGLAAGLKWLGEYMKRHHITVMVDTAGAENIKLPEDQTILLYQSVRELLINASKYAGTGQATVTMTYRGQQLHIEVQDHGVGFHVATGFAVNDSSMTSAKFGLLSIRERMTALGGSFILESHPERGTTATLVLPLQGTISDIGLTSQFPATPSSVGARRVPVTGSSRNGLHKHHPPPIRLLLVDDHAMVRQGLRTVLESYADVLLVGEAGDGEEAIQLVHTLRPEVVVMDINMPRLGGIEATACIKSQYPDISVIGLSVNTESDKRDAMRKAGAALLLTKEAALDELYQAIRRLWEN